MRINILGAHLLLSVKALFKKTAAFILTVACVFSFSNNVNACTTFYLRNGDHFVVGRNFDLSYARYLIFANRRHVTKTAIQYPGQSFSLPAIWTSKYGSITFNMVGSDVPTDGMNEEGLLVSSMILSSSIYPEAESLPSILTEQLLQYFLDNCSTIDEVIDVCSNLEIHPNIYTPWNLHYLVVDNSGNCAAVEFIDGNITVTRDDDLEKKVLANSTYSLSMEYFNDGRNPDLPLTASLNRFYTAVEMTDAYAGEDIVDYSYSVMDAVEQYFTQRKIVYDIPNMRIYLKTLENTQLRYFDLSTFDFSCQEGTEIYSESLSDVGNIRDLFVPLTFELNKTAVQSGWNYMHLTYTEEELDAYSQLAIDYEPVFASAGEDVSTCEDYYEVSGNTATYYTGSWSVESGQATFDDAAAITTQARNLGTGENRVRWTLSGDLGTFYDEIILTSNKVTATVGEDVSVCEDQYILTGNQPGIGESGQWEVISGSGNIQFATDPNSSITDLPKGITEVRWTVSNNDCESSEILEITNNSVETFAGIDEIVCGDEADLEALDPSPYNGSWKLLSGSAQIENPNAYVTVVNQLGTGENSFEWEVTGLTGCSATDIVVISNNQVYASAGDDVSLCDDNYTLTGNQPGNRETGQWEIISGSGIIQSVSDPNSLISDLPKGTTQLQWSVSNNDCESSDILEITNNSVEAFAGTDEIICGTEVQLEADDPSPNSGSWKILSGSAQIASPNAYTTFVNQLGAGENRFEWEVTGQAGCSATDIVVISNNEIQASAGNDVSLCENYFTLTGNPLNIGETGQWEIISGAGNIQSISEPNSLISNLPKGTTEVKWTVSYQDCEDADTLVIMNNEVDAFAGTDKVICGAEIQMDAVDPTPNTGSWKVINGGSKLVDPTENSTAVEQLEIGENRFEWTVIGQTGCSATDIVVVTNDLVPADAGEDQTITSNNTYLSANEPIAGIGEWSILEGGATISDINSHNSQALNLEEGINKFIWEIINNNCFDKDTVAITYSITSSVSQIDKGSPIKVFPNPFSEVLNIDMTAIKGNNAQLNIFNSRGQLVYSVLLSATSNKSTMQVSLGNLPKGNYFLTLTSKEIVAQKVLLKL